MAYKNLELTKMLKKHWIVIVLIGLAMLLSFIYFKIGSTTLEGQTGNTKLPPINLSLVKDVPTTLCDDETFLVDFSIELARTKFGAPIPDDPKYKTKLLDPENTVMINGTSRFRNSLIRYIIQQSSPPIVEPDHGGYNPEQERMMNTVLTLFYKTPPVIKDFGGDGMTNGRFKQWLNNGSCKPLPTAIISPLKKEKVDNTSKFADLKGESDYNKTVIQ
jgi:hypothetical protein